MGKYWETKEGKRIKIRDLTDGHLLNIIKFVKRKAKAGIPACRCGGHNPDEYWFTECDIKGDKALKFLGYGRLKKEATKRNLITHKGSK